MASYSSQGLDHLGLVSGMCDDIGVAQIIDQATPAQSPEKHITFGKLVEAMILNGLGFVGITLYMYPEYFEGRSERLLGEGIKVEHINDDALNRCLDQLYETGVSELYQRLSVSVVKHLNLPCEALNFDLTTYSMLGIFMFPRDRCTDY